jgi:hypothetical protein
MGNRNPYSLSYDKVRKAVLWGEIGPDAGRETEEHNLATAPGNYGWPFFSGRNIRHGGGGTEAAPLNTDGSNTGVQTLPPAVPAIHSYPQACAIAGPIYRHDPFSKLSRRFPAVFDGIWFVADWREDSLTILALDAEGKTVTGKRRMWKSYRFDDPIDLKFGPDGSLYVMNYAGDRNKASAATGILRIDYTGSCVQTLLEPKAGNLARSVLRTAGDVEIRWAEEWTARLSDPSGRNVRVERGKGPGRMPLVGAGPAGLYLLTVSSGAEHVSRRVVIP